MLKEFKKVLGDTEGVKVFFAPGRVNLIGEHTDYNGGHVFPCALTIGTYAAVRPNDRKSLRLYSANFAQQGVREIPLGEMVYRAEDNSAQGIGSRTSRLGYATSTDGIHFERDTKPAFYPAKDNQVENECPGGTEDPQRI